MTDNSSATYRYLDTEADRKKLVEDFSRTRRLVLQLVDQLPEDKWYEPRYHGWSPAAMLGHLHLMDNLSLWWIQMALVGIRPPVGRGMVDSFNNFMGGVFRQRVVGTTRKGIEKNEARLADFILQLPMDKFTVQVYHPNLGRYLTVEQALQSLFLFHWEDHLRLMREVEGIYYEPPRDTSV